MAELASDRYLANDACLAECPEHYRQFIDALRSMLEQERPAGIQESHTILRPEGGSVLWTILPHRALDGTSIICHIGSGEIAARWGRVISLAHHDDLDMARAAGEEETSSVPEDATEAGVELVRAELSRPITLTIHDGLLSRRRLLARIRVPRDGRRPIRLGSIRDPDAPWWDRLAGREVDQVETSMRDDAKLPIERRPRLEKWGLT